MSLLFDCYLLFNGVLLAILVRQTHSRVFGRFAGSAVNPLLLFCLIHFMFNLDFIIIWNDPELEFVERVTALSAATILDAYGVYTCIFFGVFVGLICALAWWGRRPNRPPVSYANSDPAAILAAQIVFWVVLAAAAPILLWFALHRDETLSGQVFARENPLFPLATFFLPAVAAVFAAYQPRPFSKLSYAALIICAVLIAISGGARNPVLLLALVIGIVYANSKRLSAWWYLPVMPTVIFLLQLNRYVFREKAGTYPSFVDFIEHQGGLLKAFFATEEVSYAKVFCVVYQYIPSFDRVPFESFIALLMYPLPRSIFEWKPMGASGAFTSLMSPHRWDYTKSESLVTGYGDLYWQFGAVGAVVAAAILAFLWLWCCIRVIQASPQIMILWTPVAIWSMFIFVRNDVFNLGLFLWPIAAAIMLQRLIRPLCAQLSLRNADYRP